MRDWNNADDDCVPACIAVRRGGEPVEGLERPLPRRHERGLYPSEEGESPLRDWNDCCVLLVGDEEDDTSEEGESPLRDWN